MSSKQQQPQSIKKSSSTLGKKSVAVWTYCEKCRVNYLPKPEFKHECFEHNSPEERVARDNQFYILEDRQGYLNLVEQSKGRI